MPLHALQFEFCEVKSIMKFRTNYFYSDSFVTVPFLFSFRFCSVTEYAILKRNGKGAENEHDISTTNT